MKKNNSIKIFNILAKRAYKISKRNKLGWKWRDAQKWTSANLFQRYKGKPVSSIKATEVNALIKSILDTQATDATKSKEVCFNALSIPLSLLEPINFWQIGDVISQFDNNLKIAIEIDGRMNTGIVKKYELSDLKPLIDSFRPEKDASGIFLVFKRLVVPNGKDDGKACSYYILLTMEGSSHDMGTGDGEVTDDRASKKTMETREDAEKRITEKEEERAKKRVVKAQQLPSSVETKAPSSTDKIPLEKSIAESLTRVLEILRLDFKEGILTAREYKQRQAIILKKFEKGGQLQNLIKPKKT